MPQPEELDLASVLEGAVVRPVSGYTYRWVTAAFPLPQAGPGAYDCATAGSYITGQRMNGKGVHGMLYTSPRAEVAALEVADPPLGLSPKKAEAFALKALGNDGFQLFKIAVNLRGVLDLTGLPDEQLHPLHHTEFEQERSCRLLGRPGLGQQLGWWALQQGYDGILRPSSAYWRRWGSRAAKIAWVLDILCPNLNAGLGWRQVP